MEDRLPGRLEVVEPVDAEWVAGVRVAVEAREGAARDQQPNPVSREEDVARRAEVDPVLVRAVRLDEKLTIEPVAKPRPQNTLGEDDRVAVRPEVDELRDEIGVARARGGVETNGQ